MKIIEPQEFAIAKNSKGQFGFITSKKTENGDSKWGGHSFDVSSENECKLSKEEDWSSSFPEVICYVDCNIYAGYQDHLNFSNIETYLDLYFHTESLKYNYSYANKINLGHIFPLLLKSFNPFESISQNEFDSFIGGILIKNTGTHSSHCCLEHGCKYGNDECPVTTGIVIQEYKCEDCDDDEIEAHHVMNCLTTNTPSQTLASLRNDSKFKAQLKLMAKLGIEIRHILD
jgi:hypothetical protein